MDAKHEKEFRPPDSTSKSALGCWPIHLSPVHSRGGGGGALWYALIQGTHTFTHPDQIQKAAACKSKSQFRTSECRTVAEGPGAAPHSPPHCLPLFSSGILQNVSVCNIRISATYAPALLMTPPPPVAQVAINEKLVQEKLPKQLNDYRERVRQLQEQLVEPLDADQLSREVQQLEHEIKVCPGPAGFRGF